MWVQLLGELPLKILESKKCPKFGVGKLLTLTMNISGVHRDIDKW